MSNPSKIAEYISEKLPIYAAFNIKLLTSGSLTGKVCCSPNQLNQNHFNSTHAGVQWMMTEMIGGIIFINNFDIVDYLLVVKRAETDFVKPAFGDIVAEGSITGQQLQKIKTDLADEGKANFEVTVRLSNSDGDELVRTLATYNVRPTPTDTTQNS